MLADPSVPLPCRADAADALCSLCAEQAEQQRLLRRLHGVEAVCAVLHEAELIARCASHCPSLLSCCVSIVRRAVLGSDSSLQRFVAGRGVEALLELLAASSAQPRLQQQGLVCLADVLLQAAPQAQVAFHRLAVPHSAGVAVAVRSGRCVGRPE